MIIKENNKSIMKFWPALESARTKIKCTVLIYMTQPPNPKMKKRKEKTKPGQIHLNNTRRTKGKVFS